MKQSGDRPGLNADARAVLLVSVLPAEGVERPLIFMRDGVRRAQFDRGRERLKAAGMLDGDTDFLNEEGAAAAAMLKENAARLSSGIPYDERAEAIRIRGGRPGANVLDGWQRLELDGQPAFTNGFLLMYGYPPSANPPAKTFQPRLVEAAWKSAAAASPKVVRPVAYFEEEGYKERTRHAVLSNGACVDADTLEFVMSRAPGAVLTHDETADKRCSGYAVGVHVEGRRVGMFAAYKAKGREGVTAILDAQGGQESEQLRRVEDDADRAARVGRYLFGRLQGKADSTAADYRFFLHADRLAQRTGREKLGDLYAALREKPGHCLTWFLLCWQSSAEELMTCTGRARGEWLNMIAAAGSGEGGQEGEGDKGERVVAPAFAAAESRPFDGRQAKQLGLEFGEFAA